MNILEFFNSTFLNESSEAVEIFLRNASFSTLFISMMFYWIQTAFSSMRKTALPLLQVVNTEKAESITDGVLLDAKRIPDLSSPYGKQEKNPSTFLVPLLTQDQNKDPIIGGIRRKMLNFPLFKSFFMPKFLWNSFVQKKKSASLEAVPFFLLRKNKKKLGSKLTNFGTITMILCAACFLKTLVKFQRG